MHLHSTMFSTIVCIGFLATQSMVSLPGFETATYIILKFHEHLVYMYQNSGQYMQLKCWIVMSRRHHWKAKYCIMTLQQNHSWTKVTLLGTCVPEQLWTAGTWGQSLKSVHKTSPIARQCLCVCWLHRTLSVVCYVWKTDNWMDIKECLRKKVESTPANAVVTLWLLVEGSLDPWDIVKLHFHAQCIALCHCVYTGWYNVLWNSIDSASLTVHTWLKWLHVKLPHFLLCSTMLQILPLSRVCMPQFFFVFLLFFFCLQVT